MIIPETALWSLRDWRGAIEHLNDEKILSADIIETIVDNFMDQMAWQGYDTADIVAEGQILSKTLTWSSDYNLKEQSC